MGSQAINRRYGAVNVSRPVLLADVGGTNARFCLSARGGQLSDTRALRVAAFETFADALKTYLEEAGLGHGSRGLGGVRIAAAGPIASRCVTLTNAPWVINSDDIARIAGAPVELFNDLEAVGHFLPHAGDDDVAAIGGNWRIGTPATRVAVNVGTGFGAAAAHWDRRAGWVITPSEAGHMSFKPTGRIDAYRGLVSDLISLEDLLSGSGVVQAYARALQGSLDMVTTSAADVFANAGRNRLACDVVGLFTQTLGTSVGDLVLAHAAWGGAFLCGSVAAGWQTAGQHALFREAFASKGKMSVRMANVPTWQIVVEQPALIGLSYASQ